MDELTIGDKIYISSKRAASITGYAKDYVGQLCREGHVEAKMVGRSWYVLESSIRAHRFGKPEPVQSSAGLSASMRSAETGATGEKVDPAAQPVIREEPWMRTWETPTYVSEEAPAIPALIPERAASDAHETTESLDMSEERESFNEMQAAWKDWFETEREPIAEPVEAMESVVEDTPEEVIEKTHQIVPEVVEEAVPIPVHRIPEARPTMVEMRPKVAAQAPAYVEKALRVASPVIIKEKRVRRRSRGPTNLVYRTLMVAVAGIVIAISIVGSGFANSYIGNNPVIEFLGGTSSIEKQ